MVGLAAQWAQAQARALQEQRHAKEHPNDHRAAGKLQPPRQQEQQARHAAHDGGGGSGGQPSQQSEEEDVHE